MRTLVRKALPLLGGALLLGLAACNRPEPAESNTSARPTYAQGDTVEVSGVLVDTRCFALDKANTGNDHTRPEGRVPGCGAACARQGIPVAVLEEGRPEGYVWVLAFPPQALAEYVGETVRVRGDYRAEGILEPLRVEMQAAGGWTVIL